MLVKKRLARDPLLPGPCNPQSPVPILLMGLGQDSQQLHTLASHWCHSAMAIGVSEKEDPHSLLSKTMLTALVYEQPLCRSHTRSFSQLAMSVL